MKKYFLSYYYWVFLIVMAVLLEMAALFYQYVLDYPPCVLCIHVRIYLVLLIAVSVLALLSKEKKYGVIACHIASLGIFAGLTERSYQLLGTERGFIFSDCNMELGLPQWLALDQWFPFIFQIHTSCGYTPVLPGGVTMAEALMLLSVILVLLALVQVFYAIRSLWLR